MESPLLILIMGVGLSAACGFRIFIPFLISSLALRTGHIDVTADLQWLASDFAVGIFLVASIIEVLAYYFPVIDNFLDSIATPAALVAGTILTASFVGDVDPAMKWVLAAITGGLAAGVVQVASVATRAVSTATTGGLGNSVVSTAEVGASVLSTVLIIALPALAVVFLALMLYLAYRFIKSRRKGAVEILATVDAEPKLLD